MKAQNEFISVWIKCQDTTNKLLNWPGAIFRNHRILINHSLIGDKTMRIIPNMNYKLLGTSIRLDKNKVYPASHASNIPNYEEREAIFVYCDNHGGSILLEKGEYVRTDRQCNEK